MFGLSKEQSSFQFTSKCPRCNRWPIIPNYFKEDGTRIPALTLLPLMDQGAIAECTKCHQRWSVFAASQSSVSSPEYEVDFIETKRTEEPIGEEQRTIDNSKSSIQLTRRFAVSKEWSQSYSIEYEKASANKQQLNIGLNQGVDAGIQSVAEDSLKERYSISSGSKQTYTEEITLSVPANTNLRVVFSWKRIWQQGLLILKNRSGQKIELPFQIAVGVTFDQTQIDQP